MSAEVLHGDSFKVLATMEESSFDAVVCDPPYGLEFMGEEWDKLSGGFSGIEEKNMVLPSYLRADKNIKCPDCGKWVYDHDPCRCGGAQRQAQRQMQEWHYGWAREAFRVLRPGGWLLAFGGSRTYHRLACAVEDAGFELKDSMMWLYGSGFPKSLKVPMAIDKHLGVDVKDDERWEREDHPGRPGARAGEREQKIIGQTVHSTDKNPEGLRHAYVPVTDEAKEWDDWGTALKPAHEPIVVGRKPLIGTVARNVLTHGTGALNIGATRIGDDAGWSYPNGRGGQGWHGRESLGENLDVPMRADAGRWPANVILQHLPDCADDECADGCVVLELDAATGDLPVGHWPGSRPANAFGFGHVGQGDLSEKVAERGGASRFFYCAKVSRAERNAGLGDDFDAEPLNWSSGDANPGAFQSDGTEREAKNNHPTVKPIDVMRWLLRLSVRPGGRVLDPFAGSGSAGVAAELEGVEYVGVEKEERWVRVARARIAFWSEHGEEALDVMRAREQAERRRETAREAGQLDLLADAG